jgi:hypothetical protein
VLTRQVAEKLLVVLLVGHVIQHHQQPISSGADGGNSSGKEQDRGAQKRPHLEGMVAELTAGSN